MPATTSLTLLNEFRLTGSAQAWTRFVDIYGHLPLRYKRGAGLFLCLDAEGNIHTWDMRLQKPCECHQPVLIENN